MLAVILVLMPARSFGDFYKYTDDNGVETFTNTPTTVGAVRVLREGRTKPKGRTKQEPVVALQSGAVPLAGQELVLPVQGVVTSNVGWRHDPIDGVTRHHNGVDIAVPTGTVVKAIAAGTVIQSAPHGGYGNLVEIDHGDGTRSLYGHNSQLQVRVGDQVEAGQPLALSGSTGRSTGPHVHFELWKNGSNVTEAYLNSGAGIPEVTGGIRSYLHSDGSLVFTNNR